MKSKLIIFIAVLGFIASACYDLNTIPKGTLGEPELFSNEFGVKKVFMKFYNYLPIEDFDYYHNNGYRSGNYWEAGKFSQGNMSGEFYNTWCSVNNGGFAYWPYDRIREVNNFIAQFPNYKANFTTAVYNNLMGEACFFRAFFYEGMAKRYGGVPIVTKVQDPFGNKDSLMVHRNTEYDTWKFIYSDLKFAMDNMPATSEAGRANKYVAAALMSRAMLYAGTIAKYTDYLNFKSTEVAAQQGYAGIDPSKANEFFQYAYDAGKVVEQGGYSLYNKQADKALNFAQLFLDGSSPENIFVKGFDKNAPNGTYLTHSYDALMSPYPDFSGNVGSESYPPYEFIKLYEMPAIVDGAGKPVRFNNRTDIKIGMEPRLLGTMFFDGDQLRGKTFNIQRGLYVNFLGLASDAQLGTTQAGVNAPSNKIIGTKTVNSYTWAGDNKSYQIRGLHGLIQDGGGESNCITGAFVRKYVDPTLQTSFVQLYGSYTDWIVFRLGEIYLNTAEAAYELGKKAEAFDYVEKIRVRAGCQVTRPADASGVDYSSTYGYPIDGNLKFIRDERVRELYGENHWWWDLRRWRIVDKVLYQYYPHGIQAYYVLSEGKYIYLEETNKDNRSWTASKAANYEPIPQGEINKNTNLLPKNPLQN